MLWNFIELQLLPFVSNFQILKIILILVFKNIKIVLIHLNDFPNRLWLDTGPKPKLFGDSLRTLIIFDAFFDGVQMRFEFGLEILCVIVQRFQRSYDSEIHAAEWTLSDLWMWMHFKNSRFVPLKYSSSYIIFWAEVMYAFS